MLWSEDELRALYQLAVEQPRDWARIADALRQRFPDRRQYTVGSVQQKYNEAVRIPAWGDDEVDALYKYGLQFPGQWDRITQLMKATFGEGRRPYIGEILERKWKRLRRDVSGAHTLPYDSDADSMARSSEASPRNGMTMSPGRSGSPIANLAMVSVPIWPPHGPPNQAATQKQEPAPPPPALNSFPTPKSSEPDDDSQGFVPALQLPAPPPPDTEPSQEETGETSADQYKFNPAEAAEILADFGCQFVNEIESALSRHHQLGPALLDRERELSAVAALADRHRSDDVTPSVDPPQEVTSPPLQPPDEGEAASNHDEAALAAPPERSQEEAAPPIMDDDDSSSDNGESKAPISSRIQRRRQSGALQTANESDSPIRPRKRAQSLDREAPRAKNARRTKQPPPPPPARNLRRKSRDDDEQSEKTAPRLRRRKESGDTETETESRKRSRTSVKKRKKDVTEPESSDSADHPQRTRSRRYSDSDRPSRRPPAAQPPPDNRKGIWDEEEEQLLSELRRQYGPDWERIGAALQARFPDTRPYSVVSVRCKWKHMCRHGHELTFDSDDDHDDDQEPESVAKKPPVGVAKPKPTRLVEETGGAKPKPTPRLVANDDHSYEDEDGALAICDVDSPGSESGYDCGAVVIVQLFNAPPSLLWFGPKPDPETGARKQLSQDHIGSDEDDALCEV